MRISFHPQAERDFLSAAQFYEDQAAGLGLEFMTELRRLLDFVALNPELGQQLEYPIRRVILRRFPFSVMYKIGEGEIRIIAIAHQRRRPGYWRSRAND